MKSEQLNTLLAPFKLLTNRSALQPRYRAIELTPTTIKACAPFGLLERAALLEIDDTMYVDATTFLAVMQSLPHNEEVYFAPDGNTLSWRCGEAIGRMAQLAVDDMPATPDVRDGYDTDPGMAKAFDLGAISCDEAVTDREISGVLVDTHDKFRVCGTDNHTASYYELPLLLPDAPNETTITSEGAKLLAAVIAQDGQIVFGEHSIYYKDVITTCSVQKVRAMGPRLRNILAQFPEHRHVTEIPPDRLNAFVRRSTALAESRRNAVVELSAAENQVALSFSEGSAVTEEYFIADLVDFSSEMPAVHLSAIKLAKALSHTQEIVVDYLDANPAVVIFRSSDKAFNYIIANRPHD